MSGRKATTVTLPDPTKVGPGKWEFPEGWTEEAIRDWLDTHPEAQNGKATAYINADLLSDEAKEKLANANDADEKNRHAVEEAVDADAPNYHADADEEDAQQVSSIAVGVLLPEGHEGFSVDTYDPREYFLIHHEVLQELMEAEAELGMTERDLRAHMRGMRKIQKHLSESKREWRREHLQHTRTARKLRRARAGRDRRDRQVEALSQLVNKMSEKLRLQEDFIRHAFRTVKPPQQG